MYISGWQPLRFSGSLFSTNTRGPRKITHILISTELLKKTNRALQMQELIEKKGHSMRAHCILEMKCHLKTMSLSPSCIPKRFTCSSFSIIEREHNKQKGTEKAHNHCIRITRLVLQNKVAFSFRIIVYTHD